MILKTTSIGAGRRNRSFLCMCSRNFIFGIVIIVIIITSIVIIIRVLMLQNRQVMITSFGCCWYSGASRHAPGLNRNNPHDFNHER